MSDDVNDRVHDFLNDNVTWRQSQSIFPRSPRLEFFDIMLKKPDWKNSKILDIGGNRGNLLEDGIKTGDISPVNYYCLDVDKSAIEFGQSQHPDANWFHHQAFNHMYNPEGVDNTKFPFDDNMFDIVVAYSVYSHTTFSQLKFDISEIQRVSKSNAVVAFTVVDKLSAEYFTSKRREDYPGKTCVTHEDILLTDIEDYKYFIDNDLLIDQLNNTHGVEHLVTIYNTDWLSKQFQPQLNMKMKFPPNGHVQKTMVFTNESK